MKFPFVNMSASWCLESIDLNFGTKAIFVQTCLCLCATEGHSFGAKTLRDEGVGRSGSPRWLVASDLGAKATD